MPLQQHVQAPDTSTKEGKKVELLLERLGSRLETTYRSYQSARSDKDREWEKSIRQYEGKWDVDDLEKIQRALSIRGELTDPVTVNITRPKTNVAIARMKDIQFPTGGDFNFYIKPAPLTLEIKQALQQDQPDPAMQLQAAEAGIPSDQIPAPQEIAQGIVTTNSTQAPKMEMALRNRMIYAEYGRKARLAIEDLCIKGTAVIKGPTIQNRKQRKYSSTTTGVGNTIQQLETTFIAEPSVERVDPLLFFPDPSARQPHEIEDAFELHPMSIKDLVELTKNPAFITDNIKKVLENGPDGTDIPDVVQETSFGYGANKVNNRYWVREYRGMLDKQVLFDSEVITEEDFDDPLQTYMGEVWFTDKKVIRMSLSHIDGEDNLPYGVTVWEKDPSSVLGHGVPYLLRNAQRVVNNAYLMLLDNASLTSGPQIVLNKEMIVPASQDEDYTIEPMKVWFLTEYGSDVREAMQFVDIPAQMEGISQIIDTSMQFADVESSTPMIAQGDVPVGNNTTTGLAMVMSATNIIQKAASMNWDDNITKPLVHRFYHYEMQYGEDESIKGDFEIEVGGATERIEAEIKSQEIERMLGLASSNEEFMMAVDPGKAFRALVDNTRTGDLLRSPEEVESLKAEQAAAAEQAGQTDPEAIKAQAAMIQAQARMETAKSEDAYRKQQLQQELQSSQLRYAGESQLAQARNNDAQAKERVAMAKLALEEGKTIAQIKKELDLAEINYDLKLELGEMDFQKMEREIEVKNKFGTGI